MRIYHKVKEDGVEVWKTITDINEVYVFWFIEVLRLVLGESPFYANYGIPAVETIATSIYPDYYVSLVKDQFTSYFASSDIKRVTGQNDPTYEVNIITNSGQTISQTIQKGSVYA